jgi:hypothetical protein
MRLLCRVPEAANHTDFLDRWNSRGGKSRLSEPMSAGRYLPWKGSTKGAACDMDGYAVLAPKNITQMGELGGTQWGADVQEKAQYCGG